MASPITSERDSLLEKEREFHNNWAKDIDIKSIEPKLTFESSVALEGRWIIENLGSLDGLSVLELGSGAGEGAVYFAMQGAKVTATDLSEGMLKVVNKLAKHNDVSVNTVVAPADDLRAFPDDSFDIVYGANLLHHVDVKKTLTEVKRVLKPGGRAAFWDPIAYNPAINVYRRMATEVRTPDEHPLTMSDIKIMRGLFDQCRFQFSWLLALAVFVKMYVIDKVHPNDERYWKVIFEKEKKLSGFVRLASAIDRFLIAVFPPIRWLCWNVSCVLRKPL